MRILAAMSGGVDSSMAATFAVEAGHEVVGVHLSLARSLKAEPGADGIKRGCGSSKDAEDAGKVAEMLGIPYEVWDLSAEFEQKVINDFVAQYQAGNTPNPCVRCNDLVKTRELLLRSQELGFDAVCTGHYARLIPDPVTGQKQLHRAVYEAKDQSYVLAVVGIQDLQRLMFPLGEAPSKQWVREQAQERGLPVFQKRDSFDICFIPDGNTQGFLRQKLGTQPGQIVDQCGQVVGEHDGYYQFTVGQRKGLHLGRPAASGKPRYVLEVKPRINQVVVGEAELLSVDQVSANQVVWLEEPQTVQVDREAIESYGLKVHTKLGEIPATLLTAQVRAHGTPSVVTDVEFDGQTLTVNLAEPIRGVAVGQSLVLYRGTQVMAESVICGSSKQKVRTERAQSTQIG